MSISIKPVFFYEYTRNYILRESIWQISRNVVGHSFRSAEFVDYDDSFRSFKILSEDGVPQSIIFAQDEMRNYYFKIISSTVFFAQGLSANLDVLTQAGVTLWTLGHIDGVC